MYPNVIAGLIEDPTYNWTDEELGKIANGNLLRVFKAVELVRDSMQHEEEIQDWIDPNDFWAGETSCMSEYDNKKTLNRPESP